MTRPILLDVQTPGRTGLQVLKQLREMDQTVPVLMITATHDRRATTQALTRGVFACVPTPVDFRRFEHGVAPAIAPRRAGAGLGRR